MEATNTVFSSKALISSQAATCNHAGEPDIYLCASLLDLELPAYLSDVCVRDLQCYDQVEKLYYSMNYDPICIHCSSEDNLQTAEGYYPQCSQCNEKERVPKRV